MRNRKTREKRAEERIYFCYTRACNYDPGLHGNINVYECVIYVKKIYSVIKIQSSMRFKVTRKTGIEMDLQPAKDKHHKNN